MRRGDAPDWFAQVGLALEQDEQVAARCYVDALGLGAPMGVATVANRQDVESLIRTPAWDARWWNAESAEREQLRTRVETVLGRTAALERLSALASLHNDAVYAAACRHLGGDGALAHAAAGAAALALHEHALARLAGAGDTHLFMRKYQLFTRGRWPLGVVHDTFHLY